MARRRIIIPEGVKCPDCKSVVLMGHGTYWRRNSLGGDLPKIKVQLLLCKCCGTIFADGEVGNNKGV